VGRSELTVPNDRSPISIVSFVECVLVELTHEPVAAEYVSSEIWGEKRTRFFAVDDTGERFQKQYSDDRLGEHNTLLSRRRVRNALINRLSRETVGNEARYPGVGRGARYLPCEAASGVGTLMFREYDHVEGGTLVYDVRTEHRVHLTREVTIGRQLLGFYERQ